TEVRACVETMSGAVWVKDQLELGGWVVDVAHAGKVRQVAPLACKTDKVDARVLAELCRRDLVPAVWVPSLEDRAIRERLRRRAHLVKLRTAARNRIFGLLTQFGLRVSFTRLREPDALELLERQGASRKPARARSAGQPSRPPTRPGARATRSTSTTGGSPRPTAPTRPRSQSPESF